MVIRFLHSRHCEEKLKLSSPCHRRASGLLPLQQVRGRNDGKWSVLFFILYLFSASLAQAAPISQFTLKNGMEVVVIENYRIPAVSHMLWFKIGGADDPSGKSGLAHFHEHIMFKGTPNTPPGEFESVISRNGGEQNAFTSYDATGYYININRAQLPLAMKLEADRMRGITPLAEDIGKERQVIIEERRARVDNVPSALFYEQMMAALYLHHPYGTPLIGWKHEMEKLTLEDVMHFHNAYHKPANAVLVLSGDITAGEAKTLVESHYGDIPRGETAPRHWNEEPPPLAARRVVMRHANVKHPTWRRDYLAPSLIAGDTAQALPLMVFAQAFGGGQTSLLYQELVVKRKLAGTLRVSYNGFSRGYDSFTITAEPVVGVDVAEIEKAVDELLEKAKKQGFAAADVARAKTLLKAESIYAREGISGMARIMGTIRTLGLPLEYFDQWPEKVDAVTDEQMLDAARSVLRIEASVTGELLPEEPEEKAAPEQETVQ